MKPGKWYIRRRNQVAEMKAMMMIQLLMLVVSVSACLSGGGDSTGGKGIPMEYKVTKPDSQWRKQLSRDPYQVRRKKGPDRPFRGKYGNNHDGAFFFWAGGGEP